MTIRRKRIPPGRGNTYLYEQKSVRRNGKVRTKHVRYIGRSGGGGEVVVRAADGSVVPNSSDARRARGRTNYPPPLVRRKTVKTHRDGDAIYRVQSAGDGRLYLDVQNRKHSGAGLNARVREGVTAGAAIRHVEKNRGRFLGEIIEHDG